MKFATPTACLLASMLLTTSAIAQDQTAPTEAAAPAAASTAEAATPAEATAPAADAPAADQAPAAQPAPVAAPSTSAFSPAVQAAIGTPPPGKALVVFFREHKFAGSAIRYKVREGETELGKLSSGTYFVAAVDPGQHTYVVHSEAKDVTNIEAEAGETYFLIGTVTMGFMAGHPNLSPSDAATFESMLPKMKVSEALK
jgi:hypothetical protein